MLSSSSLFFPILGQYFDSQRRIVSPTTYFPTILILMLLGFILEGALCCLYQYIRSRVFRVKIGGSGFKEPLKTVFFRDSGVSTVLKSSFTGL